MTALELMERLDGEILNNKVRATIDGEIVILARLNDQEWELTEKGQELANLHSNIVVDEAVVAKPSRKKAAPAVESEAAPVADTPVAETEQAPTAE